ncbi:MAG: YggT family protein [Actinobacteria bacterium]|nr:YggT family protein [Actinomycetota bacterium]
MSAEAVNPFLRLLCYVLTAYSIILLALFVTSFLQLVGVRMPTSGPGRAALDLLDDVTRPVLEPLRRLVPPVRAGGAGIDLSLAIAFVILWVLRGALCS